MSCREVSVTVVEGAAFDVVAVELEVDGVSVGAVVAAVIVEGEAAVSACCVLGTGCKDAVR